MLKLVTAPTKDLLTLDEVKAHSRIEGTDSDELLNRLIRAVTSRLDGRDGELGRALATQTWDLSLHRFTACIRVPLPPLQSVSEITYVDTEGATQTLDASKYQVSGIGGWGPGSIDPAYNETWPTTRLVPEAVKVRFVAGYPEEGSPAVVSIPEDLRDAMLKIVGHWYENREQSMVGVSWSMLPDVDAALARHTVHHFA